MQLLRETSDQTHDFDVKHEEGDEYTAVPNELESLLLDKRSTWFHQRRNSVFAHFCRQDMSRNLSRIELLRSFYT
jgi:hypothetical protein